MQPDERKEPEREKQEAEKPKYPPRLQRMLKEAKALATTLEEVEDAKKKRRAKE